MSEEHRLSHLLSCMPAWLRAELESAPLDTAQDIRLRAWHVCRVAHDAGEFAGKRAISQEELTACAQALSGYTLRTRAEKSGMGFQSLEGGHRMGLCGRVTDGELCELGSVCIRIAREVRGAALCVLPSLLRGGCALPALITGKPGAGKTTLLRDIARLMSDGGLRVCVADERGEIAACVRGVPQLDVGERTDVLDGCIKARAMPWLVRAMCPDVLMTDELGGEQDFAAVREAIFCGVPVIATAHGERFAQAPFSVSVRLTAPGAAPEITCVS